MEIILTIYIFKNYFNYSTNILVYNFLIKSYLNMEILADKAKVLYNYPLP